MAIKASLSPGLATGSPGMVQRTLSRSFYASPRPGQRSQLPRTERQPVARGGKKSMYSIRTALRRSCRAIPASRQARSSAGR
jgi:hypothetical protein